MKIIEEQKLWKPNKIKYNNDLKVYINKNKLNKAESHESYLNILWNKINNTLLIMIKE